MKERAWWIWKALLGRCKDEGNWSLSKWKRWLYTGKVIVALIFNLPYRPTWGGGKRRQTLPGCRCEKCNEYIWGFQQPRWKSWRSESPIEVATLGGGSYYVPGEPTMYWATVILVPWGWWGWRYAIEEMSG